MRKSISIILDILMLLTMAVFVALMVQQNKITVIHLNSVEMRIDTLNERFSYIADSLKFSVPASEVVFYPEAIKD